MKWIRRRWPPVLALALLPFLQVYDEYPSVNEVYPGRTVEWFSDVAAPSGPYADATAVWTFNDIESNEGLGLEGNDGFVGQAMDAENGDGSFADLAYNIAFHPDNGTFGACGWARWETLANNMGLIGMDDFASPRDWGILYNTSGPSIRTQFSQSNSIFSVASVQPVTNTAGTRVFFCGWWDSSDGYSYGIIDDGSPTQAGTNIASTNNANKSLKVAGNAATTLDGAIGPVAIWKGSVPPYATLYNDGKGKRYADLSAAEKTNLQGWWEWNGTILEDQHGSNDMTSQNSPGTATGLTIEGDGDPDLYMTPTNTPTAMGGALGYATYMNGTSEYADGGDILNSGNGVSWGFAGWFTPHTSASTRWLLSKLLGATAEGHWDSYYTNESGGIVCRLHDGVSLKADSFGTMGGVGSRHFFHCRYDATANEIEAGLDATWSGSPGATAGDGAATAVSFNIASYNDGTPTESPIIVGPVAFYRSASGGQILTNAITTSLYNSGKGKTCADLSGAELTNLVSCWEMDEDGGPYVDSIGSNDLTGVSTPTRAAGLVERSDSGMAGNFVAASTQYLTIADNATLSLPGGDHDFTVATWYNRRSQVIETLGAQYEAQNSASSWLLYFAGGANPAMFVVDTAGGGDIAQGLDSSLNEWHLAIGWRDSSDDKIYLQIDDGTPVESSTTNTGTFDGTVDIRLAIRSNTLQPLEGLLDNFALWRNKKLSAAERATLWNSGAGTFFAAHLDTMFWESRIHFAWSQEPRLKRVYVH